MPRRAIENNRMSLRIRPRDKATIMRASVLAETDITDFMVRTAVAAAQQLIERSERVTLSARDSLRVLELLEHPPAPNSKLIAAAQALPPLA
ncbi:MAG: DUF1778 domain-containing protein [Acidobacteriota bacterium]|nr:DUF1778 domain-containing protein [Acidobacteriota bacterium]